MKRLVLIGNGFDLAHGMKTGYNDFLLWYLKVCFKTADISLRYSDELIGVKAAYMNSTGLSPKGFKNTELLFDTLYANSDLYNFLTCQQLDKEVYEGFDCPYFITIKSDFFLKLIEKCNKSTWVEIENGFYDELKLCLKIVDPTTQKQKLNELNSGFNLLTRKLEEYLLTLEPNGLIQGYTDLLAEPIAINDLVRTNESQDIHRVETLLLSFNYTATAENYIKSKYIARTGLGYQVNHIHGKAGDPLNPIIFGFGDELDADYALMENTKTKGFFKYIKSFWYFRTQNYHNLIRFIESDNFQVYVLGHSCGLSDRTMLNMIFEHPNCKSIKIYYHGRKDENNFTETTEEISRHFKNKSSMRDKIVPLLASSRMPQFDDDDNGFTTNMQS